MRIAIVGAGISGLVAAHLLHPEHEIVVYEAGDYAGGHTNTVRVPTARGAQDIDTGFIVMNDRNYPNFTRLLDRLGVARQPTHMSFSVKAEEQDFEYAGTPRGLFCQPRNAVSPRFGRMILDLLRFNRELRAMLEDRGAGAGAGEEESLADFLARRHYSRFFVERLIVPQAAAVWSADPAQMQSFPVRFLAEFFANHGMLGFRGRPQWSTIVGGSARYVEVSATDRAGAQSTESFDQVLIATHSDQALEMLRDASPREVEVLGSIPYQRNEAVLHTDASLLPRRPAARAAWNYHLARVPGQRSTVTYWMNHLQRLRGAEQDYCVTLNRSEAIDPRLIIRRIEYSHPVFTPAGVAAQARHGEISGTARRTHYCGAYWGWGFHEDGVRSALAACAPLGVSL